MGYMVMQHSGYHGETRMASENGGGFLGFIVRSNNEPGKATTLVVSGEPELLNILKKEPGAVAVLEGVGFRSGKWRMLALSRNGTLSVLGRRPKLRAGENSLHERLEFVAWIEEGRVKAAKARRHYDAAHTRGSTRAA